MAFQTPVNKPQEYPLTNVPTDGITAVRFEPRGVDYLLVSSWDTGVRLYDVTRNTVRAKYNHKAPVLDCCFSDVAHCFSGGIDSVLKMYDINTQTETVVGEHQKPIRCLEYNPNENFVVSGSWDNTTKFWDPRTNQCIGTYTQPAKVFTMALSYHRLIVGTANRHIWIWDMRRMGEPEQQRESSLKYQTRSIRAFTEGDGFALSSTEGRVAMEYFDPSPQIQSKKYAFKCHRLKDEATGTEHVYPANVIAFHPDYGTFATGGCDGIVNIWDGKNKKRLCQFRKYPTSISALCFNSDGTQLAIASSYTFYEGEREDPTPEQIFIRNINDVEVRPKSRGPAPGQPS